MHIMFYETFINLGYVTMHEQMEGHVMLVRQVVLGLNEWMRINIPCLCMWNDGLTKLTKLYTIMVSNI